MKKLGLFAGLLLMAGVSNAGWNWGTEDQYLIRYTTSIAANLTSTAAIVVDLSSGTYWPHKNTREADIQNIKLEIDKAAASTCTVRIGLFTFVDSSTANVTWIWSNSSGKNASNTNVVENYSIPLRCRVNASGAKTGDTPYILSNETSLPSTAYGTTLKMQTVKGISMSPEQGDIFIEIDNGAAAIDLKLNLLYSTQNW